MPAAPSGDAGAHVRVGGEKIVACENHDRKQRLRRLKFGNSAAAGIPSPLAGEGGDAQSAAPGEGGVAKRNRKPRVVSEQVAFARSLRRNSTDAERRLWAILRQPPFAVAKFRRQVPIGPFVADFLSYSHRLIIEVDGGQHADSASDRRRDAWLRRQGYRVERFWNADVLANPDGVTTVLLHQLDRNRTPRVDGGHS